MVRATRTQRNATTGQYVQLRNVIYKTRNSSMQQQRFNHLANTDCNYHITEQHDQLRVARMPSRPQRQAWQKNMTKPTRGLPDFPLLRCGWPQRSPVDIEAHGLERSTRSSPRPHISASWDMSSQCQGQHLHPASSAHPGLTTQVCGLMHQITLQVQITVHSIYVRPLRKHITSTPKPLDKQKSDSTTSQIQTATTISQNSMINSELRACQAVHSDKLGIKTWPNQHEASPNFLFCIAVGPKEVRLTSRLTAWSGQLDLPHAPTLAHRGACHRNAKDCICTRPAVHTLGSRPKCVGWCQTSNHSNSSKAQSNPYTSGSYTRPSLASQDNLTSRNPTLENQR